jgi:hypothetical protein
VDCAAFYGGAITLCQYAYCDLSGEATADRTDNCRFANKTCDSYDLLNVFFLTLVLDKAPVLLTLVMLQMVSAYKPLWCATIMTNVQLTLVTKTVRVITDHCVLILRSWMRLFQQNLHCSKLVFHCFLQ